MIAEVIPGFYDVDGKRIWRPSKKRHRAFTQRPMGLFTSQPLKVVCKDIDEIRAFLSTCRYVPDQVQFGVEDHWMAPEQFEQARKGDCEDFALWTWRQLLSLGYDARFVGGSAGRYGDGHAWVTFRIGDKSFVLEPQLARISGKFPRLDTLRYNPLVSVETDGTDFRYFEHARRTFESGFRDLVPLIPEWLSFRLCAAPRLILRRFFP